MRKEGDEMGIFNKTFSYLIVLFAVLCGCTKDYSDVEVKKGGFVGSQVCAGCHDKIASTWKTTPHSMVINKVTGPNDPIIVGDWGTKPDFTVKAPDGTTMTVNDLGTLKKENIMLTHGVLWKQRYVYSDWEVQKFQWNIADNYWAPYHYTDAKGPNWKEKCSNCHVTGFQHEDYSWAELSIGCEACHGPGERHVKAKGERRANTIYNPVKLPWHLASDICGQCHTRGKSPDNKYDYPMGYQVGKRLVPSMFSIVSYDNRSAWWPSGAVKQHRQQYPEWMTSQHYKAGISCTDCHTSHSAANRFSTRISGNNLCLGCHPGVSTDPTFGHAPIKDAPQHSNCIACHMSRTGKSATVGDEATHTFRVILPRVTMEMGGGDVKKQPNSCNLCHYHADHSPKDLQARLDKAKEMLKGMN
jgi:predicted CXXCH cytochrome family protein